MNLILEKQKRPWNNTANNTVLSMDEISNTDQTENINKSKYGWICQIISFGITLKVFSLISLVAITIWFDSEIVNVNHHVFYSMRKTVHNVEYQSGMDHAWI